MKIENSPIKRGGNNTVLCAIQFTNREPWRTIQRLGQFNTFLSEPVPDGFSYLIFKGRDVSSLARSIEKAHESFRYKKNGRFLIPIDRIATYPLRSFRPRSTLSYQHKRVDVLEIEIPDLFPLLLWKYLGLYRHFIENTGFDFLYTTNSNCYIQPTKLLELVQRTSRLKTFAGTPLRAGRRNFVSGANRLMSRDVVKLILDHFTEIDRGFIEDVSQGDFLVKRHLKITSLPTEDIHSMEEAIATNDSRLRELHQVRIKTKHSREIEDVKIMEYLHSRVKYGK